MIPSSAYGIVLRGDRRAEVISSPVPEPQGTQVLVRTHAVGLCGSDLALYKGTYEGPRNYPLYFGHEWSGTVAAVGSGVRALKPGDKVTGDCSIYCGECEFCEHDRNLCRRIEKFGITLDGASRQFFLQDERYLYAAPAEADLDLVALSEPLAVGARAVQQVAGSRPGLAGEKVLVMGGGAIGLACLIALINVHGCERVELFDLLPGRVELARSLGAAPPGDVSGDGSAGETYGSLYSGHGYDAIFETTGAPAVFRRAVDLLRPRGTIMALGFIPSVEFRMKTITLKAANIMGSMGGTGQFPVALDFVSRRPEMARALIAHRVPFEQVDRAFELALGRDRAPKVLVSFDRETGETI